MMNYLLCSLFESALLLNLLLISLQVLDHQVFSRQLKVVPVMIDPLCWVQMEVVQYFINGISFDPQDVPVLPS